MDNKARYRELCRQETSIPIFSQDWWLDTVCGTDRWEVLIVEQKGRIRAAMPLYVPHAGIVSMPAYTQTMGPWFAPVAADMKYTVRLSERQQLCGELIRQLSDYPHFYQHFHFDFTDWLPFYWAGYTQMTRYTYRFPELRDLDRLWQEMRPNIRRNIQKAQERHLIEVRPGVTTEAFLQIQRQTFQRQHRTVPQSEQVLCDLIRVCRERGQGEIWGGFDPQGHLHAAAFVVWQPSSAWYLAGGGDPALRESGAHSLVLWEAIQAVRLHTNQFDFEGSMLPGVERFFREFGALQTPYYAITKGKLSLLHRAWLKLQERI